MKVYACMHVSVILMDHAPAAPLIGLLSAGPLGTTNHDMGLDGKVSSWMSCHPCWMIAIDLRTPILLKCKLRFNQTLNANLTRIIYMGVPILES